MRKILLPVSLLFFFLLPIPFSGVEPAGCARRISFLRPGRIPNLTRASKPTSW